MKVGLNLDSSKVRLEVSSGGGISTNVEMTANVARVLASQLIASAETLERAIEQGLIDDY